jgi:hypothetical protein
MAAWHCKTKRKKNPINSELQLYKTHKFRKTNLKKTKTKPAPIRKADLEIGNELRVRIRIWFERVWIWFE